MKMCVSVSFNAICEYINLIVDRKDNSNNNQIEYKTKQTQKNVACNVAW